MVVLMNQKGFLKPQRKRVGGKSSNENQTSLLKPQRKRVGGKSSNEI
jgi:hypothetical protein